MKGHFRGTIVRTPLHFSNTAGRRRFDDLPPQNRNLRKLSTS